MPAARPWQDRLWEKVDKNGPDGCWNWTAFKNRGYGSMVIDGKTCKAYRLTYELLVGPIAEGLVLDHLCRNPSCVNPEHLEPVTQGENVRRGRLPSLTMEQAEEIRERLRDVEPLGKIARDYGVHENTIWHIAAGWTWDEIGWKKGEPIRPKVFCLECDEEITTGQRHKKFCCAQHRSNFNNRERYKRMKVAV